MLDAQFVEAAHPLLELRPVGAAEGHVVEADPELAETVGRRPLLVLVQPEQGIVVSGLVTPARPSR